MSSALVECIVNVLLNQRTPGQKLMFELHRYSALASVLAAMVYVGLELFERSRPR